jgi:hypothetical protein
MTPQIIKDFVSDTIGDIMCMDDAPKNKKEAVTLGEAILEALTNYF